MFYLPQTTLVKIIISNSSGSFFTMSRSVWRLYYYKGVDGNNYFVWTLKSVSLNFFLGFITKKSQISIISKDKVIKTYQNVFWEVQSQVEWFCKERVQLLLPTEAGDQAVWCNPGQQWSPAGVCTQTGVVSLQRSLRCNQVVPNHNCYYI